MLLCCGAVTTMSTVGAVQPRAVPPPQTMEASSQASEVGGTYDIRRAFDGKTETHWASRDNRLPQTIRIAWDKPVTFDTIVLDTYAEELPALYAQWKTFDITLDSGLNLPHRVDDPANQIILRLDHAATCTALTLRILEVFESRHYVGLDELTLYLDPDRLIRPLQSIPRPVARAAIQTRSRPKHPCVYVTPVDVARARRNAATTPWGKAERATVLSAAAYWLRRTNEEWLRFLPEPGDCYAYGFTGCPRCGAGFGIWDKARCSWDEPGVITCANGHRFPDDDYPDDGTGYHEANGRGHYLRGIWNAWVTEQWTRHAIPDLAHAYALTGEERYAEKAAFFLDALASIYAESTSGSWDYPSRPPSGRFARPWYQVARNLVVFVEAYDLIYTSPALESASVRPAVMQRTPDGPTRQQRAVQTEDAHGWSRPGMTRRENIERNLMLDGAYYCYRMSFHGGLHNGAADYLRGALAVGALLGVETYLDNAVESPYSIYAMLANNVDRDGRYYETALGYALHARTLYLSFVEPLLHWRDSTRPGGINLFDNVRMRSLYYLPDLSMDCTGHAPNFGDVAPDNAMRFPSPHPFSQMDYRFAEWLYAYAPGPARQDAARILAFLARGKLDRVRNDAGFRRWLLYHAEPLPPDIPAGLPKEFQHRLFQSWVMGQKGIGILRDGRGTDAQAALLRFGPSLNHGDKDDLGLLYYAKGWQMTYEIGYGLGSTHTQVGWASQTASHCLVTVDESSQAGAGSGGSLRLFAHVGSLHLIEAESPLSYSNNGVTQYRRTVAIIGKGKDQILVDLFRVRGGKQHDYTLSVQTRHVTATGIDMTPSSAPSLAADGSAWGQRIGLDGDIIGYPNKPYWNPPPENGYGFFHTIRTGKTNQPFEVTFTIGGRNNTRLHVHALPEPDTDTVLADAPGLYPDKRAATTLMLRRGTPKHQPLASLFAAVLEPEAHQPDGTVIPGWRLQKMLGKTSTRTKYLAPYDTVFCGGKKAGDGLAFTIPVEQEGTFRIRAGLLRSPSYGTVMLRVDGKPLGQPFNAHAPEVSGPTWVIFGDLHLTTGDHEFRFVSGPGEQHYFSLASLDLQPPDAAVETPSAKRLVTLAERLPLPGETTDTTPVGIHVRRNGRDEYLFSAGMDNAPHAIELPHAQVAWHGAIVFLAFRDGKLVEAATCGASNLSVGGKRLGPDRGYIEARIAAVDEEHRYLILDRKISTAHLGPVVHVRNPRYSRDTSYRLYGVEDTETGTSRLNLGPQPVLLGRVRVHQIRPGNILLSDVPHDYARSVVSGPNTHFFDGKRITNGRGAETTIHEIVYGQPMTISVDDTAPFSEDDTLLIYDVRQGDTIIIPTAWSE